MRLCYLSATLLVLTTACGTQRPGQTAHAAPAEVAETTPSTATPAAAGERWSDDIAAELMEECLNLNSVSVTIGAFALAHYDGSETPDSSRSALLANDAIVATDFAQDPRAFLVREECDDDDCMERWGLGTTRADGVFVASRMFEHHMPVGPELGFHWESLRVVSQAPLTVELSGLRSGIDEDEEGLRGSGPWEPVSFRVAFGEHVAIGWQPGDASVEVAAASGSLTIRACGQQRTVMDAPVASSGSFEP